MRPPIENMPTQHPTCLWCGRKLLYWTNDTRERQPGKPTDQGTFSTSKVVRRVFTRFRGYPVATPIFDTLRCALAYAVAAHKAGYRRTS